MRLDPKKIDLLLAQSCMSLSDLRGTVSPHTIQRIRGGKDITPKTAGKIAKALQCDVEKVVEVTD